MRCNKGKIRVCQENEGSKFKIYKYVLEGWVIEFVLRVPVAKEEGNVMNYEILREKQQLFKKSCVLAFSSGYV